MLGHFLVVVMHPRLSVSHLYSCLCVCLHSECLFFWVFLVCVCVNVRLRVSTGVGWGGGAYIYNIVSGDFPWGFPHPLTPPEEERFTSLDLRVPAFPSVFGHITPKPFGVITKTNLKKNNQGDNSISVLKLLIGSYFFLKKSCNVVST